MHLSSIVASRPFHMPVEVVARNCIVTTRVDGSRVYEMVEHVAPSKAATNEWWSMVEAVTHTEWQCCVRGVAADLW